MINISKNLQKIAVITGLLLGAFAISALADWSAPGTPTSPISPPNCPTGDYGCDAPINVGAATQYKSGPLGVGATSGLSTGVNFEAFGTAVLQNLLAGNATTSTFAMTSGAGANKVLTSDANGNATWKTPSGGSGGSGVSSITSGTTDNLTISPTTGDVVISAHGTVGGGCYSWWSIAQTERSLAWGNGVVGADPSTGANCLCPSTYTAQQILSSGNANGGGPSRAYICLKN